MGIPKFVYIFFLVRNVVEGACNFNMQITWLRTQNRIVANVCNDEYHWRRLTVNFKIKISNSKNRFFLCDGLWSMHLYKVAIYTHKANSYLIIFLIKKSRLSVCKCKYILEGCIRMHGCLKARLFAVMPATRKGNDDMIFCYIVTYYIYVV